VPRSGDPVIGESGDRKTENLPQINTDDTDQEWVIGKSLDRKATQEGWAERFKKVNLAIPSFPRSLVESC